MNLLPYVQFITLGKWSLNGMKFSSPRKMAQIRRDPEGKQHFCSTAHQPITVKTMADNTARHN